MTANEPRPLGSLPPYGNSKKAVDATSSGSKNDLGDDKSGTTPTIDEISPNVQPTTISESKMGDTSVPTDVVDKSSSSADSTDELVRQGHRGPRELGLPVPIPGEFIDERPPSSHNDEGVDPFDDGRPFRLPSQLFGVTTTLAILTILSLGILFIYGQVLSILGDLTILPPFLRYLGYTGLGAIVSITVAFICRLIYLWFRLKTSPGIRLRKLDALAERDSLRTLALHETLKAKKALETYVREFHVEGQKAEKALRRNRLTDEEIRKLRTTKKRLMDKTLAESPTDWIRCVDEKFLKSLDQAADRRIKRVSILVAAKTAATPNPNIDSIVAAFNAFGLIGDLCRIYNLRTGGLGTFYVLIRAFANVYLAGQMEEATETLAETIIADSASIGTNIFGKFASKVGEGGVNGILLYRLGHTTKKLVRPIRG